MCVWTDCALSLCPSSTSSTNSCHLCEKETQQQTATKVKGRPVQPPYHPRTAAQCLLPDTVLPRDVASAIAGHPGCPCDGAQQKKGEKASKNVLFDCVSFCSMRFCLLLSLILTSVADPGSSVFLPRDLWSGIGKIPDPGHPGSYFWELSKNFLGLKFFVADLESRIQWIFCLGSGILEVGW